MRSEIRTLVKNLQPFDDKEATTKAEVLSWIDSPAELWRLKKPDRPNKHLVSYFVVIDVSREKILLVDHKLAQRWLPTGGHVEPGEHPKQTVSREIQEELGVAARFIYDEPLFLTSTTTAGRTPGHIDVSFWYCCELDEHQSLAIDLNEFYAAKWFHRDHLPFDRTDPELYRFMAKLSQREQELLQK